MATEAPGLGLLFPGQGTQHVGMGRELAAAYPEARATFVEADEALGEQLAALCWDGPADELDRGTNAQPAIVATSAALWRVIVARTDALPLIAAGHSLGQYSAMVASGTVSLVDSVRLVRRRALAMQQQHQPATCGMLVVLGMDDGVAEALCTEMTATSGAPVTVANYNCPGQVVIAGPRAVLETAAALARERGARRAALLAVDGCSHTPLMEGAAQVFAADLKACPLAAGAFPVVGSTDFVPLQSAEDIRGDLLRQLTHPIRWPRMVEALTAAGAADAWEVGAKSVLRGLTKRINPGLPVRALCTASDVDALLRDMEAKA